MNENVNSKKGSTLLSANAAIGIALFALFAFVIITIIFYHSEIIPNKYFGPATGNYAQLIAGVIGSLLSFAGIILIYVTFKEQRVSNKTQEEKLNQQTELFNQQQFETTFFNLIENHFRIIRSFDREFYDNLRKEMVSKSGYNQIDECYRKFRVAFETTSIYQLSSPYSNYQTINFYPMANENIYKAIVKKSAANIQLIIDYIISSRQIKENEKEIYTRILFTSPHSSSFSAA